MKTKFWSVAVALLALVLCGTALLSYAQEAAAAPAAGWHGHGQHHMAWMAKRAKPDRCPEGSRSRP